jgi:predicted alpha/beta hydrolase
VCGNIARWSCLRGRESKAQVRTKRPVSGTEQIDIRTSDGWSLRADVHEPNHDAIGVAVLAHAMMARRSEFDRPRGAGLARFLVDRGWRVVAFDFRGHGDSGPGAREGASYGYDDFVARDLPAVHAFARSRSHRKHSVVLVGHSLGGHAALASQGVGLVAFDGIAAFGACVWLRVLEHSEVRWAVQRASLLAAVAVCRRLGRLPARTFRLGSDDETRAHVEDFERFARTGMWSSADGHLDYLSSLGRIRVPVLQIVSDGDHIACTPDCGTRFVAHCGGRQEVLRIERCDDGGSPPDHMGLVTSGRTRTVWDHVESWMRRAPVISSIDSSRT